MSVTFEAMLVLALRDRDAIEHLNRLLRVADAERGQTFNEIDTRHAGGNKSFCLPVYAACFNHFVPHRVEECIEATPWQYPEAVLYVCDLGDYGYDEPPIIARTVQQMRVEA